MSVYRRAESSTAYGLCFEGKAIQRTTHLTNRREAENDESVFRARLSKRAWES